jgi:hypothetical protein
MPLARIVIAGTIRFALGSAPPLLVPELELLVAFFAAKVLLAVGLDAVFLNFGAVAMRTVHLDVTYPGKVLAACGFFHSSIHSVAAPNYLSISGKKLLQRTLIKLFYL